MDFSIYYHGDVERYTARRRSKSTTPDRRRNANCIDACSAAISHLFRLNDSPRFTLQWRGFSAGCFGNIEALGRPFASGGFDPRLSSALPGFVGGTEDTIRRALRAGKPVELPDEAA